MSGASIPESLRQRVRASAKERCGYCLSPQRLVLGWLEIEHIVPKARGGTDDEQNLWLACRLCNNWKSDQTEALDPESNQTVPWLTPAGSNDPNTSLGATTVRASLVERPVAAPRL